MQRFRLPPTSLLVALCFATPILAACGTPAIAGVPDSMTVYGNGKPIAQVPTGVPVITMPGMEMVTPTSAASSNTAVSGTSATVVGGTSVATPTDYVLYNILYGTGTPGGQPPVTAAATAASGKPSTTLPTSTFVPTSTLPPSPTAVPTQVSTQSATHAATQSAASSGSTSALPAGTAELVAQLGLPVNGDPTSGKAIFSQSGCGACHDVANGVTIVGPSLKGVAVRAATRKPGYSAIAYLRESILYPNAYVVQGFSQGIMPQTFGQQLTKQQIDDVVSYLLTLGN